MKAAPEMITKENVIDCKTKVTADDIRKGYTAKKARNDLVTQTWVYIALRPLSFYLAPFFIRAGLGANAVTTIGLMPLLAAASCMVLGSRSNEYFVAGAILINIWFLMDVIDGNIARYEKKDNKFGELFDWLIGLLAAVIMPLSIGLGLYGASINRTVFDFGMGIPGWAWLTMGITVVVADFSRNIASLRAKQVMQLKSAASIDRKVAAKDIIPRSFMSFQKPLMLIVALFGWMGIFLALCAFYSLATMVGMLGAILYKARQFDRDE